MKHYRRAVEIKYPCKTVEDIELKNELILVDGEAFVSTDLLSVLARVSKRQIQTRIRRGYIKPQFSVLHKNYFKLREVSKHWTFYSNIS